MRQGRRTLITPNGRLLMTYEIAKHRAWRRCVVSKSMKQHVERRGDLICLLRQRAAPRSLRSTAQAAIVPGRCWRACWSGSAGDTLVVVRIDRLARSLSHLLEVIERLEAKGAFFRSLLDPIDTASPQGKFTLQVLGAAAEFERALIRERTKAGLASARTKGRVGGNPGLRAKDPAALRKVRLARQDGYMERLNETAQDWVPHVRRLRPDMAWEDVLRIVNAPLALKKRQTDRQTD